MPNRAKSFASALLGGVLVGGGFAAAVLPGLSVTASAASECLESPNQRTAEPGHWYYHLDRALGRRCWYFEPSEARSSDVRSSDATASPAAAPAATTLDSQQSLLSRFAAGVSQTFSVPPQQAYTPPQASIPDDAGDTAKASPRTSRAGKVTKREKDRLQAAPAPVTSGAANSQQTDQSPQPASGAEKDEKPAAPINVADREALFQDFIKWQRDRAVFGYGGRW